MFAEVRREESHRSVMMGGSSSTIYENSALVAINSAASAAANAGGQGISKKAGGKGKIGCDHCNNQWHTCWKLHGKTQNLKNSGRFHERNGQGM